MSPEQAAAQHAVIGSASDLYSLGVILARDRNRSQIPQDCKRSTGCLAVFAAERLGGRGVVDKGKPRSYRCWLWSTASASEKKRSMTKIDNLPKKPKVSPRIAPATATRRPNTSKDPGRNVNGPAISLSGKQALLWAQVAQSKSGTAGRIAPPSITRRAFYKAVVVGPSTADAA